jgi:hypothetical protein
LAFTSIETFRTGFRARHVIIQIELITMAQRAVRDPREIERAQRELEAKRQRAALALQRQREIWSALVKFIHGRGGLLESVVTEQDIRIAVPQDSKLADELETIGYRLRPGGTGERIIGARITPVLIYTFRIPWGR